MIQTICREVVDLSRGMFGRFAAVKFGTHPWAPDMQVL